MPVRPLPLAIGILVFSYVIYLFCWPYALILPLMAIGDLFRRSKWTAVILVALSPIPLLPMLAFLGGIGGYLNGTAWNKTSPPQAAGYFTSSIK